MHNRIFITVSQDEVKGKGKQIEGKVREEAGKLTDNKRDQVKGRVEQTQGKAREAIGKLKEVTRRDERLSSGVRMVHSSYLTDLDLLPSL
jgi:uncharacterized protein YjbJ (UPF0337 family)